MPTNFSYLSHLPEYALFAPAAIETEQVLSSSPAMAAVGARKALELAIKWVYAADEAIETPYKDNLQALIYEPSFKSAVDSTTWGKLPYIIKLGNLAVHTDKKINQSDAVLAVASLFDFIQWLDYSYGKTYAARVFDEDLIPQATVKLDIKAIKANEALLVQKEAEIERLTQETESQSRELTALRAQNTQQRVFTPDTTTEFETRKKYIDVDLKLLGWTFGDDVREEVEVSGMPNNQGIGFVDYVLYGKDGLPLGVIEAKKTSKDPKVGLQQSKLYADCLEHMTGRRPIIFITNGFETFIWDDKTAPQRPVSGVFAKADLEKLMNRRTQRKKLAEIEIQDAITDRYYQKEAIRAVCQNIESGHRKSLLVMATGTGKTRTSSSLTDVLSRGGYITNVLFLADRTALVKQAKDDYKNYLPDMSLCNLLTNADDKNARIVFSTYPTMLNAIDSARNKDGTRLFTPAHFDLIIIDEAHRSIFKKYRAIFEYFDALLVGLTATPKTDVDRNTYSFFEMESGVPTYAYDYETATDVDHVLVPYHNIEVQMKFIEMGINYDELSEEDKERYEEDFTDEAGDMPDFIPPPQMNKFIFNQSTVDNVLERLMTAGLKIDGGDKLGKTIIFAANKRHAEYIVERFNILYPQYNGEFARRIVCDDNYAQSLIADFKSPAKMPFIAVSVDMLDTGIDVPEVLNLVFFKKVRSKTKFWQMLGRGTRLCKDIFGPGNDKQCFYIFDYCTNFEFFRTNPQGIEAAEAVSLVQGVYVKKIRLIQQLQDAAFMADGYQAWRNELAEECRAQINALNPELVSVHLQLRYIEKFKEEQAFTCLTETDKGELCEHIAPIVFSTERDVYALRFDNFMYGLMLAQMEGSSYFKKCSRELVGIAESLAKKTTIPQIKAKIELIKTIQTDEFWDNTDVLTFEKVRAELRGLNCIPDGRRINEDC
jgi:type I restriction enzyme, R subunit